MKNLKLFIVILLAVAMCMTMVSCDDNNEPGGGETPNPDDYTVNLNLDPATSAELTILIPSGNRNETTMIDALFESFNLLYPNITLVKKSVAVDNWQTVVRNMAATDSLPDIIWADSDKYYYLVDKGLAVNLDKYVDASEEANVFDLDQDFHKEFFDMGSVDGSLYTIPRSADAVVTFINTETFNAAGIDLNPETTIVKNGWTWEEFLSVCETLRVWMDNNGRSNHFVIDANLTAWLSCCYPMIRSYGGEIINKDGEIVIDSAATRECLEMVRYMVEKRYICDSTMTSGSSYENGTSPMLWQSCSVSLQAEKLTLKGKVDIVSFPLIGDTPCIGAGIAGYSINNKCEIKDVAWAFLNHMLSYDGQQAMGANGLSLASIRKDLADYTVANWGRGYTNLNLSAYLYGNEYKISTEFLSYADMSYTVDITQAVKDLFNNAANASSASNKSIEECIEAVVRALEDAMDL